MFARTSHPEGGDQTTAAELLPRSRPGRVVDEIFRFGRKGFARIAEFAPTRLNVSWVTDELAVGGAIHTRDIARLRRMGITAIADCREEAADDEVVLAKHGIAYLRIPTPDACELAQPDLRIGVVWVNERLAQGEKVYVHCKHGVGRAPLLASCLLVAQGASAEEALHRVKSHRWQASPNEEQVAALVTFATNHRASGPQEPRGT